MLALRGGLTRRFSRVIWLGSGGSSTGRLPRADALFELTDAVLCADGPVRSLVELTLVAEHRRGHGAMYDAVDQGGWSRNDCTDRCHRCRCPGATDGRIVLAVDVSPWLRSDARTSAERLFCHVYGRSKGQAQLIPGWRYSFVAALEPGPTSWTALLDAVRLVPADDAAAVTAQQLRGVLGRLIAAGHWRDGDPPVLIVTDAGYDALRLAYVLADLPVELLGRLRCDRVLRLPKPPRRPGTTGTRTQTQHTRPWTTARLQLTSFTKAPRQRRRQV